MNRSLIFLAGIALVLVAGFVAYRISRQPGAALEPGPLDLSMEKLKARNPRLTFTHIGNRAHGFWVTDPATGRSAILPWQQSEDALVEFVPCTDLPGALLYPKRSSDPVCLRVTNDDGVLSAFSFHAPDRLMYDVAAFYDGARGKGDIRGTSHEVTGRYETGPDGVRRFRHSYFFFINPLGNEHPEGLAGFVGYRKEKKG